MGTLISYTLLLWANLPIHLPLLRVRRLCRPLQKVRYCLCPLKREKELTTEKHTVLITCVTYLVVIFGGQYLLRDSAPMNPQVLFKVHNFLLTFVSLALLLLLVEQLVPQLARHGLYYTICSPDAWTQKHELLYYLNYLVKYWELLDTVFLVVKKKKLGKVVAHSCCVWLPCSDTPPIYRIFALLSS